MYDGNAHKFLCDRCQCELKDTTARHRRWQHFCNKCRIQRRAERLGAPVSGLCTQCGQELDDDSVARRRHQCGRCRLRARQKHWRARHTTGVVRQCAHPGCTHNKYCNSKYCQEHLEAERAAELTIRARARSHDCSVCGARIRWNSPFGTLCGKCSVANWEQKLAEAMARLGVPLQPWENQSTIASRESMVRTCQRNLEYSKEQLAEENKRLEQAVWHQRIDEIQAKRKALRDQLKALTNELKELYAQLPHPTNDGRGPVRGGVGGSDAGAPEAGAESLPAAAESADGVPAPTGG